MCGIRACGAMSDFICKSDLPLSRAPSIKWPHIQLDLGTPTGRHAKKEPLVSVYVLCFSFVRFTSTLDKRVVCVFL